MLNIYQKYKNKGFKIIGISLDEDREPLEKMIKEKKIGWPQVFDGKGWRTAVAPLYDIQGIPATYLLDKHGVIRYKELRGSKLEHAVAELISEP